MKVKTRFRISQRELPPAAYRFFARLVPSAVRVDDVWIEAQNGESLKLLKIALLVAFCRAFGLRRSNLGDPGTYGFVRIRHYEPPDLDECDILIVSEVRGRDIETFEKRDAEGRLILQAKNLKQPWDFAQADHRIVLSAQVREAIEKEGFRGVAFRDVSIQGGDPMSKYWELASTNTLPKLANTERLMCYGMGPTGKVEPFKGDYSRMVFIHDPPYAVGEPHYRRSDLVRFAEFDLAETFEHLWIPQRSFVMSRRFYRLLQQRRIPINVLPVRVDED